MLEKLKNTIVSSIIQSFVFNLSMDETHQPPLRHAEGDIHAGDFFLQSKTIYNFNESIG